MNAFAPPLWLRIFGYGFAGLCGLSALVQLNDPDWGPWFFFYLFATAVAALAPHARAGRLLAATVGLVALVWAASIGGRGLRPISFEELTGDLRMKTENTELWRELGGLLIVAAGMAVIGAGARAPRPPGPPHPGEHR